MSSNDVEAPEQLGDEVDPKPASQSSDSHSEEGVSIALLLQLAINIPVL